MFIDRLVVHNNTMVKNTTYLAHTHYCHVKMYQFTNLYKKTVIIPTHMCTYYVLRISLHQAHILLNNGEAELTIP